MIKYTWDNCFEGRTCRDGQTTDRYRKNYRYSDRRLSFTTYKFIGKNANGKPDCFTDDRSFFKVWTPAGKKWAGLERVKVNRWRAGS